MTISERDEKIRDFYNFIADKYKDLQMRSARLKNPEDKSTCLVDLKKMRDDIEDATHAYAEIEYLEVEDVETDEDDFF